MATRGINKVMLIGHLGQEPEVRQMAQGGAVTTISLATSESWRDRQTGQQQERTEWHRVVFIGKIGEIAGQYLKQGRTWQSKSWARIQIISATLGHGEEEGVSC